MGKIIRTDANEILAKAVEYHGFVYTQGVVAQALDGDVTSQTRDVLAQITELLERHGTDNTRLLQVQIWLRDITDRTALNAVWVEWLPQNVAPARACVQAELADPRCRVEIMVTACR